MGGAPMGTGGPVNAPPRDVQPPPKVDEELPPDEVNGNVRVPENGNEADMQDGPRRRRHRGGRGRRGRGGQGGGQGQGNASAAGASSGRTPPSGGDGPRAAEAASIQPTGSADRHLINDEPVAPQPVTRPRTYRDLDSIPDDFD
jgi:ribonuclease E